MKISLSQLTDITKFWRTKFSISEWENNRILQAVGWLILFGFF